MAIYGTLEESSISAISASISGTATDVFVYDTTKDSDGGAWRKRTRHTSWYNETLNTATRGSRREFPVVAVIVTIDRELHIYDGDDPDLPLWMKFVMGKDNDNGRLLGYEAGPEPVKCTYALNGIIATGESYSPYGPLRTINFVSDSAYGYNITTNDYTLYPDHTGRWVSGIGNRNTGGGYDGDSSSTAPTIVDPGVNDITMTVLPNAPIDPSTRLPVPTIAVATDGGVSVIKDDGTVVDITWSSYEVASSVYFKDNYLWLTNDGSVFNKGGRYLKKYSIPSSDISESHGYLRNSALKYWASPWGFLGSYTGTSYPPLLGSHTGFYGPTVGPYWGSSDGTNGGLTIIGDEGTTTTNGLVAYATTSYNTGWMHGDIKGAFLSDTDTTSLVATDLDLVTNGSFATDSDWTKGTGWTISGGTATHTGTGGDIYQEVAVVAGRRYLMTVTVDLTGDTSITDTTIGLRTLANNSYYVYQSGFTANAVNTVALYWTSTITGNILARCYSVDDVSLDNWVVQDVTDDNSDRSVNDKGLQVFGTVTKSAVATGADLVAYSGFSQTNYLVQPYNSDFNFGTGDFSFSLWIKSDTDVNGDYAFQLATPGESTLMHFLPKYNTNQTLFNVNGDYHIGAGDHYDVNDGWVLFNLVRSAGQVYVYKNANLIQSFSAGSDLDFSGGQLTISNRQSLTQPTVWSGYLALFRVSASAPSPEQIKKIYEDEKVLFQENAKCTLYGSSDAVTALAYDEKTELLHVGTSSGRSDFQGLRRINNTTSAVTTAISAYDGSIAQQ